MPIIMFNNKKGKIMKKTILIFTLMMGMGTSALAHGNHGQIEPAANATLSAVWLAAFLTAVLHTIMGPDHYLPFIAIGKSRGYSLKKTLLWTFICGISHIASALLIALAFIYFSHWLNRENFVWLENNRGNIAAYALIGLGAAYLLWALRRRWQHRHNITHQHLPQPGRSQNISVWVLFIIFVLGPCEALLPILTASSVLGASAVISSTVIFSVATIATMMLAVTLGILGINALRFKRLEAYAHEIAGGTIMACGLAIICGL